MEKKPNLARQRATRQPQEMSVQRAVHINAQIASFDARLARIEANQRGIGSILTVISNSFDTIQRQIDVALRNRENAP